MTGGLIGCAQADHAQGQQPNVVHVYAAASTTDVMSAIAEQFTRDTGIEVVCNFASSSTLARQIQNGAPADVFLSANVQWMDELEREQQIDASSRVDLLGNSLVVVAPSEQLFEVDIEGGQSLADVADGRIAIGDPEHVPAGRYARKALIALGWWDELEPRIVAAVDVRAALHYVEQTAVDAGIVYATDARASQNVAMVCTLPTDRHDPIVYPAALTAAGSADGARFLEFLKGDSARSIFRDAGFDVLH